ncbi:cupin domain-containing protein [Candidatus Woesearchaeota archaeon]|nr:cupin domain-containing protein [Candidatus Woesearchaeota archaeon]
MKRISLKEVFSDSRGKIESIQAGIPFREMNKFSSEPGKERGGHYHKDSVEMIFVIEGKVEVTLKNIKTNEVQTFTMRKDEGIVIEPYEAHKVRILEKSVWINALTKEYNHKNPDIFNQS